MVTSLRKAFNAAFTPQKYQSFLADLYSKHPGAIAFRVAETPVFADKVFTQQMLDVCEHIIDIICDPQFRHLTEDAIPRDERVPNETSHSQMIVFDFGVCISDEGRLEPQLIEMQGFPTLFAFQVYYPEVLERHFHIPGNYTPYLSGYTKDTYITMLKKLLLNGHEPENVILLEIKPHEQKTRIDFYCTQDYTGVKPVCISELMAEGRQLFYINKGKKTRVKRIYNRIIFDELKSRTDLGNVIDITQSWEVEWITHPNWFYRISKFTLPLIRHPYVPQTFFLNEVKQIPPDLENYVLKPLFSFAGQGVVIDVTSEDLEQIKDPHNWILQRKVKYADVIDTPDMPAKAEIRIMYVWPEEDKRPHPVINLARLSKGKMIGVRYNAEKDWVGGSVCYFETY